MGLRDTLRKAAENADYGDDKLVTARCRLMIKHPWYGYCAVRMVWRRDDMSHIPEHERSIGCRIIAGGQIEVLYYAPWVETKSVEELIGTIQHMIEHLVRMHIPRREGRERHPWHYAADMCVNGTKDDPRIAYKEGNMMVLPDDDMVFIPKGWDTNHTAEEYYNKILEIMEKEQQQQQPPQGGQGQQGQPGQGQSGQGGSGDDGDDSSGDGSGQGQDDGQGQGDGQGQPNHSMGMDDPAQSGQPGGANGGSGIPGVNGNIVDNHEIWESSTASEDEARQSIKNMVSEATQKAQGTVPGHLIDAIKKLNEPVVRWQDFLQSIIGRHVGSKRYTFSRRNRRVDIFRHEGHQPPRCF